MMSLNRFIGISLLIVLMWFHCEGFSQGCCSGGSASPLAGGVSQGVLGVSQMEFAMTYQHASSNRFKTLDRDTVSLFDRLYSNYLYGRVAYGLTSRLMLSVESGYFINKTQTQLDGSEDVHSGGIGDLIIFPRYQLMPKTSKNGLTEIVVGLGYKIPLGKYNDSTLVYTNPTNGQQYFTTSPPTIQPTTGSQDFIFYGFSAKEILRYDFKVFTNLLYIKKGWNPLGQKFGDYASVGLFVSKTFFKNMGLILQLRGEYVAKMKADRYVDMLALYNVDVASTGTRKLFFVPQVSYTYKQLTCFAMAEIPLYQYANGTQVVSQHQFTTGLSYRFYVKKGD